MRYSIWKSLITTLPRYQRLYHILGSYGDYGLSLLLKKPIVWHYPPAVMIEPTNLCNLKCPLCPCGNGSLQRPRGYMDYQLFRDIADKLHRKVWMLMLWNQGEPFLNPDFYRMLEYASTKSFFTMTSTNASLNLDCERIVRSGLSKIIISMDGISAQTYNSYRVNGNYDLVMQNLRELVSYKVLLKSKIQIVWQFIVMKHNEHELAQVKHLAGEIGVDKLELKTVQIYNKEDIRFLPSSHRYSRYAFSEDSFQLKTKLLNHCRRLWTQPVLNWDGEMSICCYDKDCSIKVGNIRQQSFSELWFGKKLNSIRNKVLHDRKSIAICTNCGEGIVQKIKA